MTSILDVLIKSKTYEIAFTLRLFLTFWNLVNFALSQEDGNGRCLVESYNVVR